MRNTQRRAKIVCTIGPAVASEAMLTKLIETGMDVARLNFSHGDHETHKKNILMIREASRKLAIPVAVLGDLQGPKIRTGKLKKTPFELSVGQEIFFRGTDQVKVKEPHDGTEESPVAISYLRLCEDLKAGDEMLFDDGLVKMQVVSVLLEKKILKAKVLHGRFLGENKGVNFPSAKLSTLGVTEKDWGDILFAAENQVDFLALSFVRTAREVKNLKTFLDQKKISIGIVSKIEMAPAIENLDEILLHSDALMVARGDLALEIGNENVTLAQKKIIAAAKAVGKPVITATQMLMSMVENPSPTRAEASDIANAVLDGTDALMLSNETATGKFPLEAVQTMAEIIQGAENFIRDTGFKQKEEKQSNPHLWEAIEKAATDLVHAISAKVVVCLTRSGQAARMLAKYRPQVPIYAFAENEKVQHQLAMCWGVQVIPWREIPTQDYTVFDDLISELLRQKLVSSGDKVVLTAGIPTSRQIGTTNTVVVRTVP